MSWKPLLFPGSNFMNELWAPLERCWEFLLWEEHGLMSGQTKSCCPRWAAQLSESKFLCLERGVAGPRVFVHFIYNRCNYKCHFWGAAKAMGLWSPKWKGSCHQGHEGSRILSIFCLLLWNLGEKVKAQEKNPSRVFISTTALLIEQAVPPLWGRVCL